MFFKIFGLDKTIIIFILLMLIIFMNPMMIYNYNKFLIGKIIIIFGIIYFTHYNIVLGLLSAGIFIGILEYHKHIIEGMTNNYNSEQKRLSAPAIQTASKKKEGMEEQHINTIDTIGSIIPTETKITIDTNNSQGVDREGLKNSIQSVSSNSLPIDRSMFSSGDNVEPFYVSLN